MGQIAIEVCAFQIPSRYLGWTRDKYTKARLRTWLRERVKSYGWRRMAPEPTPRDLQHWVSEFSESVSLSAVANIQAYFSRLSISGLTSTGRRAASQPLLYERRRLQPSASDIGAVGEAVAGYYLEQDRRLVFEVRPFNVNPDFIFLERGTRVRHLIQVKAGLHTCKFTLTDAIDLLEVLAKSKMLRSGKYVADVVYVSIITPDDYSVRHLAVEESV